MRIILLFLFPIMLFAHSLSVTASYEGKELFIESYFGNGNPCKGCGFTVTHNEKEIFKDVLDDEGVYENEVEFQTPFSINIDGGMGHWADVAIEKDEAPEQSDTMESSNATMNSIDETKIRQIIRSELNKQNTKIEGIVNKHKSKLEQILVGLGYILGVFGLWQLFARRYQK